VINDSVDYREAIDMLIFFLGRLKNPLGISIMTIMFILTITICILNPYWGYCGSIVPYTKEAKENVEDAAKKIDKPQFQNITSEKERMKTAIEFSRKIFDIAGYNYDDTIVQLAEDIQNHPERIPWHSNTIVEDIIVPLHIMMSECERKKIDCLKYFSIDTANAIKKIVNLTGFEL
jgi:hypothetical protein